MTANTGAYIDSKDIVFTYNSVDISADIVGHNFNAEYKINDVTTFGQTGNRWFPSIDISTFTLDLLFNQVTTTGTQTVVGAAWAAKSSNAFILGPAGSASGNTKISGNAYVHKYEIIGKAGNAQTVRAEFKIDNGVTVGTY